MAVIFGKVGKLYFGDKSGTWGSDDLREVRDVTLDIQNDIVDVTNNGTAGSLKVSKLGCSSATIKCSTNLEKSDGVALIGKGMTLTIASTSTPITSFNIDASYDEAQTTETGSSAHSYLPGRGKITGKISTFAKSTTADLTGEDLAFTLSLTTGYTIAGTCTIANKSVVATMADAVKIDYTLEINTATLTIATMLPVATETDFSIILDTGLVTSKEYWGKAFVSGYSISGDIGSEIKVDYTMRVTGGITEEEKTDA